MIGTSIIPPKNRLIDKYYYHVREFDWLNSNAHLDEWISQEDSVRMTWHREEMSKLEKVLNVLYPGWEAK